MAASKKDKTEKKKRWKQIAPMTSAIAGILCACSFSLTTFAWLNDSVDSPASTITAGNYSVEIVIDGEALNVDGESFTSYTVSPNVEHTVSLKANGSATMGFVIVKIDGVNYFSEQIVPNETIEFTMESESEKIVKLGYRWGRHGLTENTVNDGAIVSIGGGVTISNKVTE